MGTLIPDPNEEPRSPAGEKCSTCFGVNQAFTRLITPKWVEIKFTDIGKGPAWHAGDPEPLNGTFRVYQVPGHPCVYWTDFGDYYVDFEWMADYTYINFSDHYQQPYFFNTPAPTCLLECPNMITTTYAGGTAKVTTLEYLP